MRVAAIMLILALGLILTACTPDAGLCVDNDEVCTASEKLSSATCSDCMPDLEITAEVIEYDEMAQNLTVQACINNWRSQAIEGNNYKGNAILGAVLNQNGDPYGSPITREVEYNLDRIQRANVKECYDFVWKDIPWAETYVAELAVSGDLNEVTTNNNNVVIGIDLTEQNPAIIKTDIYGQDQTKMFTYEKTYVNDEFVKATFDQEEDMYIGYYDCVVDEHDNWFRACGDAAVAVIEYESESQAVAALEQLVNQKFRYYDRVIQSPHHDGDYIYQISDDTVDENLLQLIGWDVQGTPTAYLLLGVKDNTLIAAVMMENTAYMTYSSSDPERRGPGTPLVVLFDAYYYKGESSGRSGSGGGGSGPTTPSLLELSTMSCNDLGEILVTTNTREAQEEHDRRCDWRNNDMTLTQALGEVPLEYDEVSFSQRNLDARVSLQDLYELGWFNQIPQGIPTDYEYFIDSYMQYWNKSINLPSGEVFGLVGFLTEGLHNPVLLKHAAEHNELESDDRYVQLGESDWAGIKTVNDIMMLSWSHSNGRMTSVVSVEHPSMLVYSKQTWDRIHELIAKYSVTQDATDAPQVGIEMHKVNITCNIGGLFVGTIICDSQPMVALVPDGEKLELIFHDITSSGLFVESVSSDEGQVYKTSRGVTTQEVFDDMSVQVLVGVDKGGSQAYKVDTQEYSEIESLTADAVLLEGLFRP